MRGRFALTRDICLAEGNWSWRATWHQTWPKPARHDEELVAEVALGSVESAPTGR